MKTLKDFEQDAGKDLSGLVLKFLENDDNCEQAALDWFYTSKPPILFGETPYEYCQREGTKGAETRYSRIILIAQGGGGS